MDSLSFEFNHDVTSRRDRRVSSGTAAYMKALLIAMLLITVWVGLQPG